MCGRDRAVQTFHALKIKEINKIIRELWQLIYKGQDIDMIEIEAGPEEGWVGIEQNPYCMYVCSGIKLLSMYVGGAATTKVSTR